MPSIQPPSNARAYFALIRDQVDPFAFLASLPSRPDPFFEEEWLDFKGKPQDDKDAKKLWSKALSGYANITDGLIIWGVDARKTPPRDIDAAFSLRLITDPQAFESKLRDWIRDATNPPVMGVEYQSYSGPTGEGFVVCLIPESSYKPHRAEFADQHYYYRAGDDFLRAEPGLLRTLFYPQAYPHLSVEVTLRFQLSLSELAREHQAHPSVFRYNKLLNSNSSMHLTVRLHNTGTATARDVYIVIQSNHLIDLQVGADWDKGMNPQGIAAFRARRPIHPQEVVDLWNAGFYQLFNNKASGDWGIIPHFDNIQLRFLMYAEGMQRQEVFVEFSPDDLSFESALSTKEAIPVL